MGEIVGQQGLKIDVLKIKRKETQRKTERPSNIRVIVKGSSVYIDPHSDTLPIGKTIEAGFVLFKGKMGFLSQFSPQDKIELIAPDGIQTILGPENNAFTFPNRLVKPK